MPKKILVIDSNPELLDVIKFLLEQEGFEVETTVDKNILADLEKIKPSLILFDEDLFEGTIVEVCQDLKRHIQTANISLIISSNDINVGERAREAKVDGYIKKPFEIIELTDMVKYTMQINANFEKLD
jgi:two-component system phosphate regulon response regulator PhoB